MKKRTAMMLILALLMLRFLGYMVTSNPLGFELSDLKDLVIKTFPILLTAIVAGYGYYWTQLKHDRRHDREVREERRNKTLDIQRDALLEMHECFFGFQSVYWKFVDDGQSQLDGSHLSELVSKSTKLQSIASLHFYKSTLQNNALLLNQATMKLERHFIVLSEDSACYEVGGNRLRFQVGKSVTKERLQGDLTTIDRRLANVETSLVKFAQTDIMKRDSTG